MLLFPMKVLGFLIFALFDVAFCMDTTFHFSFDNVPDGMVTPPFVGTGTFRFDGMRDDGVYALSSFENYKFDFSFDGGNTYTEADLTTPEADVLVQISTDGNGVRMIHFGGSRTGPFTGSLDFGTDTGTFALSFEPDFGSLFFEAGDPNTGNFFGDFEGIASGDPHFKKWNGQWFDFHGICDQVLITSPDFDNGLGLDIHVRTKPRYEYSFIEATAVKIGEDIFQVGSFGQYWLNGVEGVELPITLANKYVVERVLDKEKQHNFVIHLGEAKKEFIAIKVFKDMVNVNVEHATIASFGASSGLLGSFPEGKMLARDGATVIEDDNLFGQEWQVSAGTDSLLFLSPNPNQHVAGVCVPPVVSEEGRRRLGEQEIKLEAAEKACAHHKDQQKMDMCIMDVLAMGDLEVAQINGAY